jgi:hypothetical protein
MCFIETGVWFAVNSFQKLRAWQGLSGFRACAGFLNFTLKQASIGNENSKMHAHRHDSRTACTMQFNRLDIEWSVSPQ